MKIEITAVARADLVEIYLDGIEKFGSEQAETFQRELDAKFRLIAAYPLIGPIWDDDRQYRRLSHFPYVIFYSAFDTHIRIESVIDGRSDYSSRS